MIETPQVIETAEQQIAFISVVVPRAEIQTVMGPTIREVYSEIAAQRIAPAGPGSPITAAGRRTRSTLTCAFPSGRPSSPLAG